ncbi:MAG TPA: carboxymuconolactone decarboxylase family protein [bacterium]|nr:carboxymuconolactone decarboxylase family protein [bacterium]
MTDTTAPARPTFAPVHPSPTWVTRVDLIGDGEATAETQEAYARHKAVVGPLHNGIRQLGEFPAGVDFEIAVALAIRAATHLPPVVVEVARLRCAAVIGCEYCVAWHSRFAQRLGFSIDQVALIWAADNRSFPGFDSEPALAILFADEFSRNGVSTHTWEAAASLWGEQGALELTLVCAAQNASSRISRTLMTPFEPILTGQK